jgi:uncharacterized protein with PQ loop repeat
MGLDYNPLINTCIVRGYTDMLHQIIMYEQTHKLKKIKKQDNISMKWYIHLQKVFNEICNI